MATHHIRIATRGSQLALWQSNWVAGELRKLDATVELVEITTSGDVHQSGPIAAVGQQGVFTKEVQAAVLNKSADVAVHSLKDLPTDQVDGLTLGAVPERENVADALISGERIALADLPIGARIGTGSLRRQAQLKSIRPDLEVVGIRGNVDTRLRKLDDGEYDAIVLAAAGLRRLGWDERITELLQPPLMLPAVGQGALGIECRTDDEATRSLLSHLDDSATRQSVIAERSMLALLHGGCSAPVGAWGRVVDDRLQLDGLVASLDGKQVFKATASGPSSDAWSLGEQVAAELISLGAAKVIAAARAT